MSGITKLHCKYPDCQHEWVPRLDRLPKVCPKCKRYGWNESQWEVNNEVDPERTTTKNKKED